MVSVEDLTPKNESTWCGGCGDYAILNTVKAVISELEFDPQKTVISSGIGCSSLLPHWVKVNAFEGIHGRSLPVATGIKLANHELNVIAVGGDGDGYGIGMGHFMHAIRRNLDITYIVHDNQIYGLTKGQYSPTTAKGQVTGTTPEGSIEEPVNPMELAIAGGATYVARSFAGDLKHMQEMIVNGVKHKGFAIIDILQPCVTFNKVNTYPWYKERVYKLDETDYKPDNKVKAFEKALEWGDKIPIGLLYKEDRPTYEDGVFQIKEKPLVDQVEKADLKKITERFL